MSATGYGVRTCLGNSLRYGVWPNCTSTHGFKQEGCLSLETAMIYRTQGTFDVRKI